MWQLLHDPKQKFLLSFHESFVPHSLSFLGIFLRLLFFFLTKIESSQFLLKALDFKAFAKTSLFYPDSSKVTRVDKEGICHFCNDSRRKIRKLRT